MSAPAATAGEMLMAVLGALVRRVEDRTPAALADEPDAVHRLRTAVRRLRNVLAAFGQYLEPGAAGRLRAGLSTYGDQLGRARDLEVRAADCAAAVTDLGLEPGLRDTLVGPLLAAHAEAHTALVAWCRSSEAADLIGALSAWAAAPALADGAARPARVVADEVLSTLADRALAHAADYRTDPDAAHALRKAGRRLRHTADAVTRPPAEVLGAGAVALGAAGARLQTHLGDHRDALLLAEHVRGLLTVDPAAKEAYDAVAARADRLAADAIAAVPSALAELSAAR